MDRRIMLIGLGPHSKRIYFNYFKKHNFEPTVLVDLKSNFKKVKEYLEEKGFKNTIIWCLPDKYKDDEILPMKYDQDLKELCDRHFIFEHHEMKEVE